MSPHTQARLPYMAIIIVCACIVLLAGTAIAPRSGLMSGANWIWHEDALNTPNSRVYLARSFDISNDLEEAVILCTADNEYTLFVNGQEAGKSPGPGASGDWWRRLDRHDVTSHMKPGENLLAVEASNVSGPAGFILKLDLRFADGERKTVVTNGSWSSELNRPEGWPAQMILPFGQPAAELGEPPVSPWGNPSPPTELAIIASDLRVELARDFVLPEEVIEIRGRSDAVINARNLLQANNNPTTVRLSEGEQVSIVLDFGRQVVGHSRIRTLGGEGVLHLAYGETLQEAMQARPLQPIDRQAAGPGEWEWTNPERRAFRFVRVTITDCTHPLEIDYIGLDAVGYPVSYKGSFKSSDELLNRIWEVGRYTAQVSMQDYFEDGVKRDRMLWMGDLRVHKLSAYYAFGDYKLAKRDLIRLADLQMSNGAIPAVGPAVTGLILPDYCAYWVSGLWEHYLHSGEIDTVELLYPNMKRQMEWFEDQLNIHSLIENTEHSNWWCFIDWGYVDKRGEVTALAAVYHHALISASKLAQAVGEDSDAAEYIARAERVRASVNERLWLDVPGVYADARSSAGISSHISQQSNSLAILASIPGPGDWESIHRVIFDESIVQPAKTPYMNFYVAQALYHMQYGQQALDLIRSYWGGMLERGATSYWEAFDPQQPIDVLPDSSMSFCHGWGSGVTSLLPTEVVGIKPIEPGFAETSIRPQLGDLEWAEAVVPTPRGDVFASWRRTGDGIAASISLPAGMVAIVGVPADGHDTRITMDGAIIWDSGKVLASNSPKLSTAWAVDRYVYLRIIGGEHHELRATPSGTLQGSRARIP